MSDLVERVRRAMHESGQVGLDDDESERALARAAIAAVLDDLYAEAGTHPNARDPHRWIEAKRRELGL